MKITLKEKSNSLEKIRKKWTFEVKRHIVQWLKDIKDKRIIERRDV
jgi:predicted transposase YbfD/YdcC